MTPSTSFIGKPADRTDGRAKVTGGAKYAAEFNIPGMAYGFVVSSAIAKGRITRIDAEAALAVKGVIQIFSHLNRPLKDRPEGRYKDDVAPDGSPFRPLYDENIMYSGQPVALCVAENFELARYAASLVRLEYARAPHQTDLAAVRGNEDQPEDEGLRVDTPWPRGNAEKAFAAAAVRHQAEYSQSMEHHNPMEPHATVAVYEADGGFDHLYQDPGRSELPALHLQRV